MSDSLLAARPHFPFLALAVEVVWTVYTMKKAERKSTPICLPFSIACRVCRNRMSEGCVEDCAINKDFNYFEPDSKMPFFILPKFSMDEYRELPGKAKGEFLAFYIIKLMEVLNEPGRDYDGS